MKSLGLVLVVCGASFAALAQPNSQFQVEVSTDNGSTSRNSASVTVPTSQAPVVVLFRSSVRYVRNDGPETILLGSARHQPQVLGLTPQDSVMPFTPANRVTPNFADGLQESDFGRLYGATTVDAVVAHRRDVPLHFAEIEATDSPGTGNNQNGNRGINTAANTINAPDIDTTNWVPLWVWGMTLRGPSVPETSRSVTSSVPDGGLRLFEGTRSLSWVVQRSPYTIVEGASIAPIGASVEILYIPSPATATLGAFLVLACRRRR